MATKRTEFTSGVLEVIPLQIGIIPFGLVYGILAIESGMTVLQTCLLSIILFGGASQIVFVQLVASATPASIIFASVSTINLRHILYSLSVSQRLNWLPLGWRIILAYLLTDEAYAISIRRFNNRPPSPNMHYHLLGTGLVLFITWQLSTIGGVLLGKTIPDYLQLDFAVPLSFIAILVPIIRVRSEIIAALIAGLVAIMFHELRWNLWLICATFSGIMAGLITEYLRHGGWDRR